MPLAKRPSMADRRGAIVSLLVGQEQSSIADLADRFAVSQMTIRRDLERLAAEGRVTIGRGEARLSYYSGIEPKYAAKQRVNAALKAQIARYAADNFVADGDVILLEGGTTVTAMAHGLDAKTGLTVITNGMYTVNELVRLLPDATIISTGGILRDLSFTYVGPQAEEMLANLHANTFFMSASGFTMKQGLTDPNPLEVQIRKQMIKCAERVVVLLDSTKFGLISTITTARTSELDVVITDEGAPPSDVKQLRSAGVDVRVVPGAGGASANTAQGLPAAPAA